jgi:hypothetical protein
VYLSCAGERDAAMRRRSPGVVSARALAEMDLAHTVWVALARPPRLPGGGPAGAALAALADAVLGAGARCLLAPRSWAEPGAVAAWLDAFRAAEAAGHGVTAAARMAAMTLRQGGAPLRDWAAVAVFTGGAAAPSSSSA